MLASNNMIYFTDLINFEDYGVPIKLIKSRWSKLKRARRQAVDCNNLEWQHGIIPYEIWKQYYTGKKYNSSK